MIYNFVKNSFKSLIENQETTITALENFLTFKENNYILKHNIEAVYRMLQFLNSSKNIFVLNGFMGSGKTYLADTILDFVNDDVLIFRNSYQEAINLDDVLLSLFKDFSVYHNEKKIVLPKSDTSVFSEKINTYIKYCNSPMLFIFDSFEINMRSKDTQKDILDFINYLSHFEKVKVIICSCSFNEEDLISQDTCVSYKLKSLSKEEMVDYLGLKGITGNNYELEELFKLSRGHYLLVELSALIMNMLDISLSLFASEYKKSARNFLEFIISKILAVSSERFKKLLLFLVALRHGVTEDFLINQKLATFDELNYLLDKHVISKKFGCYYVKTYIKNEFIKLVNKDTQINVHKYLISVYEEELPLKPFDRALFLSRLTMRQEISYHNKKLTSLTEHLSAKTKTKKSDKNDFNYLTYSRTSGYEESKVESKKSTEPKKYIQKLIHKTSPSQSRFELSDEDSLLLNLNSKKDNISNEMNKISKQNYNDEEILFPKKDIIEEAIPDSLDDYLNIAQKYEDAFNFASAILYYKKALTYNNDDMFKLKEPVIYTKLAICYKKIQDADEAVRYYEKVYNLYLESNSDKANLTLLNIAKMYSEVYKFDKAKEVYNRILFSPITPSQGLKARVYLDLSELEDNNLDIKASVKYAQMALNEAEKLSDTKLLCECYFKFAILQDDIGRSDLALKYYLRCIQLSDDVEVNEFLSNAYTNLAELSVESKNMAAAKMYYELAINADKKQNNYEGLYFSYSKLANIYKADNPDKSYEFLVSALSAAKKFDDISYSVSVYIELGDYYLDKADFKRALKSYVLAKTLSPAQSSLDEESKINLKLKKTRRILGDIEFDRLLLEIKKK